VAPLGATIAYTYDPTSSFATTAAPKQS